LAVLDRLPLGQRIANVPVACVEYILKMIWPENLAVFYPHPADGLPVWQVVGAALFLIAVSAFVVRLGGRRPYLPVGWLWYLVTILPVIGLVQVGMQAMADRYTYVPLIGLFIMIAWGAPDLMTRQAVRRKKKKPAVQETNAVRPIVALAGLALIALTVCAWRQVGYWRDSFTLFDHAATATSDNYIAHNNVGTCLIDDGDIEGAIRHYREALRSKPDYALAHFNLANALGRQGKVAEAVAEVRQGLRISPKDAKARFYLGVLSTQQGKLDEAVRNYRESLRLNPDYADAHNGLGIALSQQGKNNEALAEFSEAVRLKPDHDNAHYNLALTLYNKGDYAGAWTEVRLARKYGFTPDQRFLILLAAKMREPPE